MKVLEKNYLRDRATQGRREGGREQDSEKKRKEEGCWKIVSTSSCLPCGFTWKGEHLRFSSRVSFPLLFLSFLFFFNTDHCSRDI